MTFVGRFFLIVLVLGFAELWLLVKAAGAIGFLGTLGLCVLTGVVGGALVRSQGLATLASIQQATAEGRMPAKEMISGLVLLMVGVMLMMPGFITDVLGFAMLIPPLRLGAASLIARKLEGRIQVGFGGLGGPFDTDDVAPPPRHRRRPHGKVIDAEAEPASPRERDDR